MIRSRAVTAAVPVALAFALAPELAAAHAGGHETDGFMSGVMHPLLGLDHLIAMIAVGLWGAQLGMPLLIALPVLFPMLMALGGLLAILGMPLPGVEVGIALSGVVLGAAIVAAWKAPVWVAVALIAAFAMMHGHAHGTELPHAAAPLPYALGFILATGSLHLIGIGIGLLNDWRDLGPKVVRGCGALIALLGLVFLAGTAA
ncbi:MAG: HupE/UreJ family protein [Pseudomonadota bacterium]